MREKRRGTIKRLPNEEKDDFFDKWYAWKRCAWKISPASTNWFSVFYHKHTENPRDSITEILSKINPQSVLDIGCGDGRYALLIKKAEVPIVVGIDLSLQALQLAKEKFEVNGFNENFIRADAKKLPFLDCSLDFVIIIGLIHHTGDPSIILNEVSRVLKLGGHLYLKEITFNPLAHFVQKLLAHAPEDLRLKIAEGAPSVPNIKIITPCLLRKCLSGFDLVTEKHEWLFLFPLLYVTEAFSTFDKLVDCINCSFLLFLYRIERILIDKTFMKNFSRSTIFLCRKH